MVAAKVPTTVAAHPPSDSELKAVLGEAYPAFQGLVSRAGPGAAEWRRYTKTRPLGAQGHSREAELVLCAA